MYNCITRWRNVRFSVRGGFLFECGTIIIYLISQSIFIICARSGVLLPSYELIISKFYVYSYRVIHFFPGTYYFHLISKLCIYSWLIFFWKALNTFQYCKCCINRTLHPSAGNIDWNIKPKPCSAAVAYTCCKYSAQNTSLILKWSCSYRKKLMSTFHHLTLLIYNSGNKLFCCLYMDPASFLYGGNGILVMIWKLFFINYPPAKALLVLFFPLYKNKII